MAIINIADRIITNLDAIVIGIFMAAEDITYYAIGANLIPYYLSLVGSAARTITPYATSLDAKGDKESLKSLWFNSSRGLIMFASLIAGGMFFVGKDFLKIWMGERFVAGVTNVSSADILKILALAALIRLGVTSGKQMCFAMRRVKFLACMALTDASLNVLLSCLLVQKFGTIGVAFGTLIPMSLTYGIALPLFVMKMLNVKFTEFIARVPWGGITILAVMFVMYTCCNQYLVVDSWPHFILKAVIFTVPGVLAGILVGTTKQEKKLLLKKLNISK
jgi:O-antigen/teichoic acid export membrane protein